MDRRGFLRLLSAVSASVAIPVPAFVLAEPEIFIPSLPIQLGTIRAVCLFDIGNDCAVVRLEAYNSRDQFGVDFVVPLHENHAIMRNSYLQKRAIAEQVLRKRLIYEKWTTSDMVALRVPRGYVEPAWMRQ